MSHSLFATHTHPGDGVVLCPDCHDGRWVVGVASGEFHLLDLDRRWHALLNPAVGDVDLEVWGLLEFHRARIGGTLSLRLSSTTASEVRQVRTRAIVSVEPVGEWPTFVRACWRLGVVPTDVVEEAARLVAET